ncbi:Chromosome-associated kinesin KIF4 [Holothuria leucospilota]|uniref:Chromosome-associated kinesin KIF4 n=1 Tax=Holothuria leucospilota TaxID=206669 RepID=A0A9Q1BKB4_HOLLE|nr:Chromosome-associated kinesin KIF4 [Holothuria leucospilota]
MAINISVCTGSKIRNQRNSNKSSQSHALSQITGLSQKLVSKGPEVMALLQKGSAGRATGSTGMNKTSSRSHAIFTIHIEQISRDDSFTSCHAKVYLVDLSGSERVKRTQAEGGRFKEGEITVALLGQ